MVDVQEAHLPACLIAGRRVARESPNREVRVLELIENSGAVGLLILLAALGLGLFSAYALLVSEKRASYWLLLVLSLLPLVLGLVGTVMGMQLAHEVAARDPGVTPGLLAEGTRQASSALVLGGATCLAFAMIAALGLVTRKQTSEP